MAANFSQDPIINVIHNSIRKGINVTIEQECDASAVILMLSAIDAMAYLVMPERQEDVRKDDFIKWADQFVQFPGKYQLTGADLYGARCAMLHSFGAQSKMSRNGECRVILWMDKADPPIIFRSDLHPGHVMVSIVGLRDALFEGMDRFLVNLYKVRTQRRRNWLTRDSNRSSKEYPLKMRCPRTSRRELCRERISTLLFYSNTHRHHSCNNFTRIFLLTHIY